MFLYPLKDLVWQYEYRGPSLQSIWLRVCPRDLDIPNPQLQPIRIVGPEGTVKNPRPVNYAQLASGTGPTLPVEPAFPLADAIEGDEP